MTDTGVVAILVADRKSEPPVGSVFKVLFSRSPLAFAFALALT